MPYKNPEDKRKWEQEHREQRNARRRMRRLPMNGLTARTPAPDPVLQEQRKIGRKGVLAFGAAVADVAIAVLSGVSIPGRQGPSPAVSS